MDADQFDMGKSCHTDNINQICGKYFTTKGTYPMESPEKERILKTEFTNSPSGLSCQELMFRFKKYEASKFSYWRSEERRRLLGVAGYDQLLNAPTNVVMDKVLQLVGQKHVDGYPASLYNEIILARKYIRDTGVETARKIKDFWATFYSWKTEKWANGINSAEWQLLRREDRLSYSEE